MLEKRAELEAELTIRWIALRTRLRTALSIRSYSFLYAIVSYIESKRNRDEIIIIAKVSMVYCTIVQLHHC